MIADKFKKAIIQSAVEGKISKQLSTDSSVFEIISNKEKVNKNHADINWDVPNNWEWTRFSNLVNFKMGKTPQRDNHDLWGYDFPWVSISDMNGQPIIEETKEKISKLALEKSFNNELVPKGTLIMSFKLTIGRVSILDIDAVHNEAIISIYPKKYAEIQKMYLYYVLPHIATMGDTKDAIKGKTLNSKSLSNLLIPVPPIEEQKRIVEKLDEIMPLIDELEKQELELKDIEDKFPKQIEKTILNFAFQGSLTSQYSSEEVLMRKSKIKNILKDDFPFDIPSSWVWIKLKDIATIRSGGTPSRSNSDYWKNGNIPWVKIKDINSKYLDETEEYITELGLNNSSAKLFDKGTILYTIFATIGDCTILNIDATTNQAISGIKPDNEICLVEYLYYALICAKDYLYNKSRGMAQRNINLKILGDLPIPIAPLEEQQRIVEKLDLLMAEIDKLKHIKE